MSGMDEARVLYRAGEGIATITLNRPRVLNALDRALSAQLAEAAEAAAEDPGVWVVVVRGAGRAFCSGMDRTVLSAGGLTVTWILLVLLWQPAVDYARSYRTVSGQLAQALEQNLRPGECVRGLSLGSGQRASFLIFNNLTFTFDAKCTVILQQTNNQSLRYNTAAYSEGADVLWQGGRRADRQEVFRLLRIGSNR